MTYSYTIPHSSPSKKLNTYIFYESKKQLLEGNIQKGTENKRKTPCVSHGTALDSDIFEPFLDITLTKLL